MVPRLTRVTPTTKAEARRYFAYSNSRLEDVEACDIYGIVHGQRVYATTGRSLAPEAGGTMHQMFAAVRLWQIEHVQRLPAHADYHGARLFNTPETPERWQEVRGDKRTLRTHEWRDDLIAMAYRALHTSDWYDDPTDEARTMGNMELATIYYCDERLEAMEDWPIWIEDAKKPSCMVGTEQTFDVMLTYDDGFKVRFIGTIDGLVIDSSNRNQPYLDDNKTASRLDEAWRMQWDMSHQLTGYCAATTTVFGFPVMRSRILGVKIKPSKMGENSHLVWPVERTEDMIQVWARWVRQQVTTYETYRVHWEHAIRDTKSCNRYFRPCSLIPFCADTPAGREEQWHDMVPRPLSPSERAIAEKLGLPKEQVPEESE